MSQSASSSDATRWRAASAPSAGRLAWGAGPRGERPDYTGLDVIIVRGDKIAALYVFLDLMPL